MPPVSTLLFDFRVDSKPSLEDLVAKVVNKIEKVAETTFERVDVPLTKKSNQTAYLFETKDGDVKDLTLLIRVYEKAFTGGDKFQITVAMEFPAAVEPLITKNCGWTFEELIEEEMKGNFGEHPEDYVKWFPALKRCVPDLPYLRTSDDRLVEYGFQEVLFSKRSDFQFVQIVKTVDFGNLLILDDYTNLAESDTKTYTHSVMNLPHENFEGKEVLILGGGDGALMKELQELNPKFVTMVDIDDVVMDACAEHMRSACGNWLDRDNREGPKHKIITGCAIKFLKEATAAGKKFDYIFGDLTDTPVSTSERDDDIWNFLKTIIGMGVQLLEPNKGKYLTHCNGKNVPHSIAAYEKMLGGLADGKCEFTRSECFVASFMETWMYYQITRKE